MLLSICYCSIICICRLTFIPKYLLYLYCQIFRIWILVLNVEYLHERNKYIHNLMIKYVKSLITCTVRKKANNNSFLQKVEFRKRFPQISWRNSCMKNKMLLVRY